jgi:hypothetical protein
MLRHLLKGNTTDLIERYPYRSGQIFDRRKHASVNPLSGMHEGLRRRYPRTDGAASINDHLGEFRLPELCGRASECKQPQPIVCRASYCALGNAIS